MKQFLPVLLSVFFLAGCPPKAPKKLQTPVYFWAVLDRAPQLEAMQKMFGGAQKDPSVTLKNDTYSGAGKVVSTPYLAGASAKAVKDALAKLPPGPATFAIGKEPGGYRSFLLEPGARMAVDEVADARLVNDSFSGRKQLSLKFVAADKRSFFELTKRIKGRKMAVIVDDEVLSAPIVMESIPGGSVILTPGVDQSLEAMTASMFGAPL